MCYLSLARNHGLHCRHHSNHQHNPRGNKSNTITQSRREQQSKRHINVPSAGYLHYNSAFRISTLCRPGWMDLAAKSHLGISRSVINFLRFAVSKE